MHTTREETGDPTCQEFLSRRKPCEPTANAVVFVTKKKEKREKDSKEYRNIQQN